MSAVLRHGEFNLNLQKKERGINYKSMCGICGKISKEPFDYRIIQAMNQALRHRGPDDEDTYFCQTKNWYIGLGHRRLSIIDLSEDARQPLMNEDNTIALVANGEIYNYKDLGQRLKSLGHCFRSQSDSEVIIHAYEEWGFDCLKEIKGMFAFAIWDANQELLFMARDTFGEKPLFYAVNKDTLSFASELPSLLKDKSVPTELDPEALLQYLHYQVTFSPKTILKGIRKLPPGHFATFENGVLKLEDYVGSVIVPNMKAQHQSIREYSEEVRHVLDRIVEPLMVSDVPIGLFLSGGLDSSLILSFMTKKAHQPIHTFSIGFEQEGFNELPWARKMANFFGTSHHEDIVDYNILGILPELITHLGEPMADASIIPYYHLSRLAASEVKVVLGGDGADEMWGGYRRHLLRPYLPIFSAVAPVTKKFLSLFRASDRYYSHSLVESLKLVQELSLAQRSGYTPWNPLFDLGEIHCLVCSDLLDDFDSIPVDFSGQCKRIKMGEGPINRMLWIDQMTFLPEDILTKVDRMSMANSLEVRAPFLHPEMASLAAGTPGNYKIFKGKGKCILKMVAQNDLPSEIINRAKHGFNVPIDAWFRGEGCALIMGTLLSGNLVKDGWMKRKYISKLIGEHSRRTENHGRKLWGLLVLEMWQEQLNC